MKTLPQAFLESANKHLDNPCLIYEKEHTFSFITYKRLLNLVENLTLSLERLGVTPGDRIAILSENRPEWIVSDISVLSLGAIFVPLHTSLSAEQIRELIYELQPKIIIVSEKRLLRKLISVKKDIDRSIILLYYNIEMKEDLSELKNDRCHFIEALKLVPHDDVGHMYQEIVQKGISNDVASIIYTIRPNGRYLGAELTHRNLVSNVENTSQAFPMDNNDRLLSVLPLSHAFERTAGYYLPLFSGSSIVYLSNMRNISKALKKHQPTVIMGVPYIYERFSKQISNEADKSKLKKLMLKSAIEYGSTQVNKKKISYQIFDHFVYKNIRKALGGNIRALISGGAPLNIEVGKFFDASGIPMLEGYGMTELSPIVSVNRVGNNKLGTVGQPLPNTEVKIDDDGEILVKSPGMLKGYFNDGIDYKNAISNEGWFKTGDYGELDEDGFLKFTGVKKDLIILSTGKKVSPSAIEQKLLESEYIKEVKVFCKNGADIEASIVPDLEKHREKFGEKSDQDSVDSEEVSEFMRKEIDLQLANFADNEQIKNVQIAPALMADSIFRSPILSVNIKTSV